MNWRRSLGGGRGRGSGAWRFPITTILAIGVAVFAALSEDWVTAAVAAGLALLMGAFTLAAARR